MAHSPRPIGLLGAGFIADWHARALRHVPGVRVAAVCDLSETRARTFASARGVPGVYASLEQMLRRESLHAVHVLTPPQTHAKAARQVLEAGVHAFVEKPMTIDAQECDELTALARDKGLALAVNHNFLFSEPYEQLRSDVKSGRLGRLDHLTISWHKELAFFRSGPFDVFPLRRPTNLMLEVGVHSLAHMLDLVGPPDPDPMHVQADRPTQLPGGATTWRRWRIHAVSDQAAVDLNFSLIPAYPEHTLHVRGTLGAGTVDFENNTYLRRRTTRFNEDVNRFVTTRRSGSRLKRHARRNLLHYALSKVGLGDRGNAFEHSIARSLQAFYHACDHDPADVDPRIAGATAAAVVGLAHRIGEEAMQSAKPAAPPSDRPTAPQAPAAPTPAGAQTPAAAEDHAGRCEVLVLGGTGFIGRELVRQLLDRGERVRLLTRQAAGPGLDFDQRRLEVMVGDFREPGDLDRALQGIRVVHHLARAHADTLEQFQTQDIEPTRRLAEKCIERGVERLIYTSSIAALNWADHHLMIRGDAPVDRRIQRRDPYAQAKAEAERLLLQLHRERGLPVVIFRPGIVIGPGGDPCHWGVGMWTGMGVCQTWGRGDNPLPFVLVEDVAAGLIAAQDKDQAVGQTFNLVDEPMLSGRDYLAEFERAGGLELQKHATPIPWFYATDMVKYAVKVLVRHPGRTRPSYRDWNARREMARYDTSRERDLLGWRPTADRRKLIEQGIHRPVEQLLR